MSHVWAGHLGVPSLEWFVETLIGRGLSYVERDLLSAVRASSPRCQKAIRAGNLGPPCDAPAPYRVFVDMFQGCPYWFNACGKHAQLAVISGRAFDWQPQREFEITIQKNSARLTLTKETLRTFTAGDGPDEVTR